MRFGSITQKLSGIALEASGVVLVAMFIWVTVSVLLRRIFDYAIYGADEVTVYMFAFVAFMSLAGVAEKNAHIRVEILIKRISAKWAGRLNLVATFLTLVFIMLLAWQILLVVLNSYRLQSHPSVLPVPLYAVQTPLFIGTMLFGLVVLRETIKALSAAGKLK